MSNRREILDQYREEVRAARRAATPIVTPLLANEFVRRLLLGQIVTRALEGVT